MMRYLVFILLFISIGLEAQNINQLRPDTAAGSIPMTVAPYFRQAYARPETVADTLIKYIGLDSFYITNDTICLRLFSTSPIVCLELPAGGGGSADSLGTAFADTRVILGDGTRGGKTSANLTYEEVSSSSFLNLDGTANAVLNMNSIGGTGRPRLYFNVGGTLYWDFSGSATNLTWSNSSFTPVFEMVQSGSLTLGGYAFGAFNEPSPYRLLGLTSTGIVKSVTGANAKTFIGIDGSETSVTAGTGISVSGSGTSGSPYVINNTLSAADGSETKINNGTGISVTGSGTVGSPYIINSLWSSSGSTILPAISTNSVRITGGLQDFLGNFGDSISVLSYFNNSSTPEARWKALTGAGGVAISSTSGGIITIDGSSAGPWTLSGGLIFPSSSTYAVRISGGLQDFLGNFGDSVSVLSYFNNSSTPEARWKTVTAGTGISVTGSNTAITVTNTGDLSNTNEIQNLSIGTRTSTAYPINISSGTGISLGLFSGTQAGLVPGTSGGSTTTFLRGDGTWQTVGGGDNLGIAVGSGNVVYGQGTTVADFESDFNYNESTNILRVDDLTIDGNTDGSQNITAAELLVLLGTTGVTIGSGGTTSIADDAFIGGNTSDQLEIATTTSDVKLSHEVATSNIQLYQDNNITVNSSAAFTVAAVTGINLLSTDATGITLASGGFTDILDNTKIGANAGDQLEIETTTSYVSLHHDLVDTSYMRFNQDGNILIKTTAAGDQVAIESANYIDLESAAGTTINGGSSDNLAINGAVWGNNAHGVIAIYNGTAPTTSTTDAVQLYAQDVSTSELRVRDEAGNITTLSPHNFSEIPEGPSEEMAWSFYSERDGKYINVDMLKAVRTIEKQSSEIEDLKAEIAELKNLIYQKMDPVKLVHTGNVNQ